MDITDETLKYKSVLEGYGPSWYQKTLHSVKDKINDYTNSKFSELETKLTNLTEFVIDNGIVYIPDTFLDPGRLLFKRLVLRRERNLYCVNYIPKYTKKDLVDIREQYRKIFSDCAVDIKNKKIVTE